MRFEVSDTQGDTASRGLMITPVSESDGLSPSKSNHTPRVDRQKLSRAGQKAFEAARSYFITMTSDSKRLDKYFTKYLVPALIKCNLCPSNAQFELSSRHAPQLTIAPDGSREFKVVCDYIFPGTYIVCAKLDATANFTLLFEKINGIQPHLPEKVAVSLSVIDTADAVLAGEQDMSLFWHEEILESLQDQFHILLEYKAKDIGELVADFFRGVLKYLVAIGRLSPDLSLEMNTYLINGEVPDKAAGAVFLTGNNYRLGITCTLERNRLKIEHTFSPDPNKES